MKIAILSRSRYIYSTARLIEEAHIKGHRVMVIDPLKCELIMQKSEPNIFVDNREIGKIDAIIPRIGSSITYLGSSLIRQFEMMNTFTTLQSQALICSRDKLRFTQVLTQEQVDFPKTFYSQFNIETDIEKIIDTVGGVPVIVKVLEGTQGFGVMLLESKNAAISVIQSMQSLKAKIIVQEFIKEANGTDLRVFVVNDNIVAAMKREGKKGDFRSNLHQGGQGTYVKLSPLEKRVALRAAKAANLKVAGVDMLRSDRGPLVLEVNSSPGLEGIEAATGINIARHIISYVEEGFYAHSN